MCTYVVQYTVVQYAVLLRCEIRGIACTPNLSQPTTLSLVLSSFPRLAGCLADDAPLPAAPLVAQSGHTYTITVAPKHTLKLSMVFRPTSVQEHAFELPLVMSGAGVVSELRRAVVADGKLPTVGIAPECSLDFGSQIVQSAGVKKVPTSLPLLLTSNVDEPVGWEFRAPSTDGQPNGKGVFRVVPGKGLLQPGVAQPINVEFLPRESKLYEVRRRLIHWPTGRMRKEEARRPVCSIGSCGGRMRGAVFMMLVACG